MRTLDMHGKKLEEAENIFYKQLDEARLKKVLLEVTFITGSGVIKDRFLKLAEEQGLHHYVPLANRGCVVVEFE